MERPLDMVAEAGLIVENANARPPHLMFSLSLSIMTVMLDVYFYQFSNSPNHDQLISIWEIWGI